MNNKFPHHFFKNISIRKKLIFSFGICASIIIVIGTLSIWSLHRVESHIFTVANDFIPAKDLANKTKRQVIHANKALSFYILTNKEMYRKQVDTLVKDIKKSIQILSKLQTNAGQTESLLISLSKDIEAFDKYKSLVFEIKENKLNNMPGLKFADKLIFPINNEIIGILNEITSHKYSDSKLYTSIMNLNKIWYDIFYDINNYLAYRDENFNDEFSRDLKNARAEIDSLLKQNLLQLDSYDIQNNLGRILKLQNTLEKYIESLVGIHSGEAWRKDAYLIRTKIGPLLESIVDKLDNIKNIYSEAAESKINELLKLSAATKKITFTTLILAVLLGSFLTLIVIKSIMIKLNMATNAMKDIAEKGNLNQTLDDSGKDELSNLGSSFNQFVEKISNVINLVNLSSTNLAHEADEMKKISQSAKSTVVQQQSQISEVAESVQEMSSTMEDISHNASLAADAAKKANEFTINGQDVVTESISSINNLATDVETTGLAIEKLDSEIKDIGSILSVIKDITEQTNLLALNAAIEAARAGEMGRGFAVVADEVRTLSQRTQSETLDIQVKIERLQAEAQTSVNAIEKGKKTVEHSVELASSAEEALSSIAQSVDTISEMNLKIADSVRTQSHNSTSINNNMLSINQIANETANTVSTASNSNHELSLMARQLRGMVEQFLLNDIDTQNSSEVESSNNNEAEKDSSSDSECIDDVLF